MTAVAVTQHRSGFSQILRAIARDKLACVSLLLLLGLAFVAIFGPAIAPFGPREIIRDANGAVLVLSPPSGDHWLGTTSSGRDILSQMIYGARPVVLIGFVCAIVPTVVGFALGLMAGYFRGGIDSFISRAVEFANAIPSDPFAIVLLTLVKPSAGTLILAISLTFWKRPTRIVRNQALALGDSAFIKAAKVSGASSIRIIFTHMAPLALPLAFVYVPIGFANAVLAEAALSFLGFGIPRSTSWGQIAREAFDSGALSRGWWWVISPGVAITFTVVAMFLVTRPFEEIIDPRLKAGG